MNKMVLRPWFYNTIPLLVWFLLLVLPFLSSPGNIPPPEHSRFLLHILISNLLLLAIFYIHTYLLYPLLKRELYWYLPGTLLLMAVYWFVWWLNRFVPMPHTMGELGAAGRPNFGPPRNFGPGGFMPVLSPMIVILCSFCYRNILANAAREELLKERETTHLRTELNFLRSQVNPHFLFNILNNLTSLARKNSDQLEPAIISLSQIMRYMLYESSDNKVPLLKEMEYLQNYINLQKLRFGKELVVELKHSGNVEACQVDPMLFIPLVENAFKYGTENDGANIILIDLFVPEDVSKIQFKVVNFYDTIDAGLNKGTGIGLKNIHRRLEILYPGKYDFTISNIKNKFIAELTLQLL